MKTLKYIIFLLLVGILNSCEEVIDLDLNSNDPQIVIEGNVTTYNEYAVVKISKSVDFDEANVFPKVEGAVVTLEDNLGNQEILIETEPGIYTGSVLTGIIGRTYYLTVETEEQIYSSISTIPEQVKFDTLIINELESSDRGFGNVDGGSDYEVNVRYLDPSGIKNYYAFLEYINGEPNGGIYVFDDRISDGQTTEVTLLSFDRNLSSGDVITIEMHCIDKSIYNYYKSFGNMGAGFMSSSTPANPYTNIVGGKLGYFSAHTVEIKQYIIP